MRLTTQTVKADPEQFQAPTKRPNEVKKAARSFFAEVSATNPELRLRWSPYGMFMGRPEEIPHSAKYFRKLAATNDKTAAAVENLYKTVSQATP